MSLNDNLMKGFVRYYNTLSKIGYIDRSHVNRLIVSNWIKKVLNGEYSILVDNNQYNLLSDLWMCVAGDCLVPYTKYCANVTINKLPVNTYINFTNDSNNRVTEDDELRNTQI